MLFLAEFKPSAGRGFLLSRRRPKICGLAEFKPKLLLSRPKIYSKLAWGSTVGRAHEFFLILFKGLSSLTSNSEFEPLEFSLRFNDGTNFDRGHLFVTSTRRDRGSGSVGLVWIEWGNRESGSCGRPHKRLDEITIIL